MKLSQRIQGIPLRANTNKPKVIPFGPWMPDRPDFANPGLITAKGVVPSADGYRPMKGLSVQSTALDARCRGAAAIKTTAGQVSMYAGDATKLYLYGNGAWSDASSATYTTAATGGWEFAAFGNLLMATNYADAVQSVAAGGTTFADMITSTLKPKAKHIGVVREFVVLGYTNDATDGEKPNRVWWSGLDDQTDFDPSVTTQSDYQDIQDGGAVQRIIGGVEYGLVFMATSIVRMTYVRPPLIFQFDHIDRDRGADIANSVIAHGRRVFFHSQEGFMMTDGSSVTPIGDEAVDRTFTAQFDNANAHMVSCAIDPINKLYLIAFPGENSVAGAPNKLWAYNWERNKWSEIDLDLDFIMRALTPGYSLDNLDAIEAQLDDLAFSLDSDVWKGGVLKLAAFDDDHKLAYFDGDNLAAEFVSGDYQPSPLGRSEVTAIRPIVDGGTVTVAHASRDLQSSTVTFGAATTPNDDGDHTFADQEAEGRFHRTKVSIAAAGSWNHAQGFTYLSSTSGQ